MDYYENILQKHFNNNNKQKINDLLTVTRGDMLTKARR